MKSLFFLSLLGIVFIAIPNHTLAYSYSCESLTPANPWCASTQCTDLAQKKYLTTLAVYNTCLTAKNFCGIPISTSTCPEFDDGHGPTQEQERNAALLACFPDKVNKYESCIRTKIEETECENTALPYESKRLLGSACVVTSCSEGYDLMATTNKCEPKTISVSETKTNPPPLTVQLIESSTSHTLTIEKQASPTNYFEKIKEKLIRKSLQNTPDVREIPTPEPGLETPKTRVTGFWLSLTNFLSRLNPFK